MPPFDDDGDDLGGANRTLIAKTEYASPAELSPRNIGNRKTVNLYSFNYPFSSKEYGEKLKR